MRSLTLSAIALCFLASSAQAAEPKKLTTTETWEHELSLSADGKALVWMSDGAAGDRIIDLWIMDLPAGTPRNLTAKGKHEVAFSQKWTPRLSPDGKHVYYGIADDLWRIGVDGEGAEAMGVGWEINEILVVPGKKEILIQHRGPIPAGLIKTPPPKATKDAAIVLFEMAWWVDPATKKRTLLDKEWANFFSNPHLLPGGLLVADTEYGWRDDTERALTVMDVETGLRTRIPIDHPYVVPPGRIGDQLIVFKYGDKTSTFVSWDMAAKTKKVLATPPFKEFGTFWSIPGADRALFTAAVTEEDGWHIYEIDAKGTYKALTTKPFDYQPQGGGVTPDGKTLYFTAGRTGTRPDVEIWSLEL